MIFFHQELDCRSVSFLFFIKVQKLNDFSNFLFSILNLFDLSFFENNGFHDFFVIFVSNSMFNLSFLPFFHCMSLSFLLLKFQFIFINLLFILLFMSILCNFFKMMYSPLSEFTSSWQSETSSIRSYDHLLTCFLSHLSYPSIWHVWIAVIVDGFMQGRH
jgi:hypothetical protein